MTSLAAQAIRTGSLWIRISRLVQSVSSPVTASSSRASFGAANQHPFGHHGKFTTMREAVLAHAGEALASRTIFGSLASYDQNSIIEFLKSLQILPKGAHSLCVDEEFNDISCPDGIDP